MNVVLLGLTGSGKSTIAKHLSSSLKLPVVSSGAIARELAKRDPHTAVALESGQLAPEEAMRLAVRTDLEQADMQRGGWILEGFPRDRAQLISLMTWTASLPTFVYLEVEPWGIIERLLARQRDDDTPDAIARRFADFESKTQPMLEILEGGGVLHTIQSADRMGITQIVQSIKKLLQ